MRVEVWYDERIADAGERLKELRALGVTGVRLMVNREAVREKGATRRPKTFQESLKFSVAQVQGWVRTARANDLTATLTFWPQSRDDKHNAALAAFVRDVHAVERIDAVEFDVEGFGWYKNRTPSQLRAAGERMRRALNAQALMDLPMMGTTYPGAIGVCVASLPWLDAWTLQAYSKMNVSSAAYAWDGRYGPGNMQRMAAQRYRETSTQALMMMGLAAYGQNFPVHGVQGAMVTAFEAAQKESDTVCYWSSKWLRPHHSAASILTSLCENISMRSGVGSSARPSTRA